MNIKLNLDEDLIDCLRKNFDPGGEWFSELPAVIQLDVLKPFVKKQAERDSKKLKFELKVA